MKRTTVMLSDVIDRRLRIEARRRGVPVAAIVREAIERHLPQSRPGRHLSFFDLGSLGDPDASERVDEQVWDAIRTEHE